MSCLHYSFFAFTYFMSKNANAKKASIVMAAPSGFPSTIDACFCHIINVTTIFKKIPNPTLNVNIIRLIIRKLYLVPGKYKFAVTIPKFKFQIL